MMITCTEQWELLDFRPLLAPNKKTGHGSIRPNTFSRKEGKSFRENVNFSELAVLASPLIIRFFSAFHIFAKMSPFHIYIYNMGPYYIYIYNMGPYYIYIYNMGPYYNIYYMGPYDIYIICTLAAASWEALAMSVWLTLRICKKEITKIGSNVAKMKSLPDLPVAAIDMYQQGSPPGWRRRKYPRHPRLGGWVVIILLVRILPKVELICGEISFYTLTHPPQCWSPGLPVA